MNNDAAWLKEIFYGEGGCFDIKINVRGEMAREARSIFCFSSQENKIFLD